VLLRLHDKKESPGGEDRCFMENGAKRQTGSTYEEIAFYFAEKYKARTLAEMLSERIGGITEGVDRALAARQAEAIKSLSALRNKIEEAQARPGASSESLLKLKEAMAAEEDRYAKIRDEIRKSSPRYASLVYPEAPTVKDAQKIISPGAAVMEYIVTDDALYCFTLTRDSFSSAKLGVSKAAIEKQIKELRYYVLGKEDEQAIKTSRKLYGDVFLPFEAGLGSAKRIIIIPDGALSYVPFEMLYQGSGYLVSQYAISYAPSINFLSLIRKGGSGNKRFLGFGDPFFGQNEAGSGGNFTRGYFREKGVSWTSLPGTKKEIEGIAKSIQGEKSIFTGKAASESNASKLLGGYGTIHFATHGYLDDEKPVLYSSLVLSEPEGGQTDGVDDGYLRAAEIFNIPIDAGLVVLSGCQTGLGKNLNGEGLMGLSTSFFYAGARSLIVSLWSVDDESTSLLFQYFYQNISTMPPAEALREAKLRLIREKVESPFLWAPFILVGNP
jgi:CHAT domain-containing protein